MRAVKSVLVMAGSLRRESPNIREDIVLIRALRDSNLPKFLHQVQLHGGQLEFLPKFLDLLVIWFLSRCAVYFRKIATTFLI